MEDLLNGCYRKYRKIGEGSGGKVYLAEEVGAGCPNENSNQGNIANLPEVSSEGQKPSRNYVALKKMKMAKGQSPEQIPEFQMMGQLNHPNLVALKGSFVRDKTYSRSFYLVMEYMVGVMDLVSVKEIKISDAQIKQISFQIVKALEYLHDNGYLHRDVKPANIMINKQGVVKLGDYSITTKQREEMTGNTTTRYYRAPQLMFGEKRYGKEIDMWSLGCTLAELVLHEPLFQGQTDISQLEKIFTIIGYPKDLWPQAKDRYPYYLQFEPVSIIGLGNLIPNASEDFLDLLQRLLTLNPSQRPSIKEVIQHRYFSGMDSNYTELGRMASYVQEKKVRQLLK